MITQDLNKHKALVLENVNPIALKGQNVVGPKLLFFLISYNELILKFSRKIHLIPIEKHVLNCK